MCEESSSESIKSLSNEPSAPPGPTAIAYLAEDEDIPADLGCPGERSAGRRGRAAAEEEAIGFTVHGFNYPRALEPYLRGESNQLKWKPTW